MKYLLVLFFAIVYEIASCPNGTFSNDAGDRCYFMPKDSTQFLLAETSCQNQNGNLAFILDSSVNYYLRDLAKQILGSNVTAAWLGGNKDNGIWIWPDGQNFSYTNWASENPNKIDGDNCMVLRLSNGLWYIQDCNIIFPYICELSQTTTMITNSLSTTFTPQHNRSKTFELSQFAHFLMCWYFHIYFYYFHANLLYITLRGKRGESFSTNPWALGSAQTFIVEKIINK